MNRFIAIGLRTLSLGVVVLAVFAVGSPHAAWAKTIKLKGRVSSDTVGVDCILADGTFTPGKGPGGYGCKTPKGEVSCTADGKCTGTCEACGK